MIQFNLEGYIAAGLIPIPISMPGKQPAGGFSHRAWNEKRPTPDEIRAVWAKYGHSANAVAILCGHGVEMLDVDIQADPKKDIDQRFYEVLLNEMPATLNKCVIERSISGGMHFWYKMPEGYEFPSSALALVGYTEAEQFELGPKYFDRKFGAILETRGRGGYGICAPTPGYDFMAGDFSQIQEITPEEHEQLWQIARSFNTYVEQQTYIPGELHNGANRPGEDYNNRISVSDFIAMLEQYGWKVLSTRGDNVYLNRPGAKHGKRTDAIVVQSKKLFVPYSTSIERFAAEKGYSPWRTYAMIAHNGDFKAAAKELSTRGFGEQKPEVFATKFVSENPVDIISKYASKRISLGNRPSISYTLHVVNKPSTPYSSPELFGVAFPGAIIAVVGKAKSRKTTVLTGIAASALGATVEPWMYQNGGRVLWIDTEQPEFYAWITHWRILVQNGGKSDNLFFYALEGLDPEEMRNAINELIVALQPTVVVIDGIADLMDSILKEDEAKRFVNKWLRPMTHICNSTIFPVLHLNKSDGQMSGWIGTQLSRKVDGTLQVDYVDDFSVDVSLREARGERFPAFRMFTEKGMHGILYKDIKPEYNYSIGFQNEKAIAAAAETQYELEEKISVEDDEIPF